MTGKESVGAFYHDLANYHHSSSSQKGGAITASFNPRCQPALFPDGARPLPDNGIDSLRHHGGNGALANSERGRIYKALPVVAGLEMSWLRLDRRSRSLCAHLLAPLFDLLANLVANNSDLVELRGFAAFRLRWIGETPVKAGRPPRGRSGISLR